MKNNGTLPLIIVFKNHALEGNNLQNVMTSYDREKRPTLSFQVKNGDATHSPKLDLKKWTSKFSKEEIRGSDNDIDRSGRGWRMAVILNGKVISAPHLDSPISDSGVISGNFTQREAIRLAADLSAGSLSFTPEISF